MKKYCSLLLMFFFACVVVAGNHKIVVKGTTPTETGNTEIHVDGPISSDTLTILPSADVLDIIVMVKDNNGSIISEQILPATIYNNTNVYTPMSIEGCFLEICDNNGVIYVENY